MLWLGMVIAAVRGRCISTLLLSVGAFGPLHFQPRARIPARPH
jgi:hypothetical protein